MSNSLLVRGGTLDVLVVDGVVAATGPHATAGVSDGVAALDASGLHVLPGLVDLQVNGALGVDITREPGRLWEVAAALPRHGVTAFCPTVITSEPGVVERALDVQRHGPPAGMPMARSLGLHVEGPMLAPTRTGAHPATRLRAPSPDVYAGWSRAAGVAIVTLAPELPGALDAVSALVAGGVVVSVGHTEATSTQVEAAVDVGARMVTHLFNAMPGLGHREPGPVGTALTDERLVVGLISDGLHVAPAVVRLARNLLGRRLLLVSDATAALGLTDGTTVLGEQEVVLQDGAVRLRDGTLAGSAIGLDGCVRAFARFTGCSVDEAAAAATAVPAALLGRADVGRLEVGAPADMTLLDDALQVVTTIVGGEVAWRS